MDIKSPKKAIVYYSRQIVYIYFGVHQQLQLDKATYN